MPTAKQRLYRTADDRVVFEGDPNAAFLLAAEGDEIPEGYTAPKGGEAKVADAPENKAAKRDANK
jgi:hypothetical protein